MAAGLILTGSFAFGGRYDMLLLFPYTLLPPDSERWLRFVQPGQHLLTLGNLRAATRAMSGVSRSRYYTGTYMVIRYWIDIRQSCPRWRFYPGAEPTNANQLLGALLPKQGQDTGIYDPPWRPYPESNPHAPAATPSNASPAKATP